MTGYHWLEVDTRRHGRPVVAVRGTRVTTDDILEMLEAGWSPEEVAEELEIPLEAVYETLRLAREAIKKTVARSARV